MQEEIKEILDYLRKYIDNEETGEVIESKHTMNLLLDCITNLQEENERLKELCDKYEEEHNTTFKEWQKDIKANLVEKVDD